MSPKARDLWKGEGDAPPDPSGRFTPEAMLRALVGFDTVSENGNLTLINWVADYLRSLGVEPVLLPSADDPAKVNLAARIGPDTAGGVVLSGHTDVVPVVGQDWSSDPFNLVRRDDRLFGRGSADMKGFAALALALVPAMQAANPARPIHLALSYDEEVGCLGAPGLVTHLTTDGQPPELAIIGEPTLMQLVNAHKGAVGFTTELRGFPSHSSQPHMGTSAVRQAGKLITLLYDVADALERDGLKDPGFDPPYSTLNVGVVRGGEAFNIIAPTTSVTWDIRTVPREDVSGLVDHIESRIRSEILEPWQRDHPGVSIKTRRNLDVAGLIPDPDGPAESLIRQLTGANSAGAVAFGTEAGIFQRGAISAAVIGPGSIDQAHKPDEFISLEQMAAGEAFLRQVIAWCERA